MSENERRVCARCRRELPVEEFLKASGDGYTKTCFDCRYASANHEFITTRKCHDCGRPTTDYRCPPCLRAWRLKHGVRAAALEEPEGPGGCAPARVMLYRDTFAEGRGLL
jgi:hypothetical protein